MKIPGTAPSTPACQVPSRLVTWPFAIELLRVFAEVPDVAVDILGVVVRGLFFELAVEDQAVLDHADR